MQVTHPEMRIWVVTQTGHGLSSRGLYRHMAIGYRPDRSLLTACGFDPAPGDHFELITTGVRKACPDCHEITDGEDTTPRLGGVVRLPAKRTRIYEHHTNVSLIDPPAMLDTLQKNGIRCDQMRAPYNICNDLHDAFTEQQPISIEFYESYRWCLDQVYITYLDMIPVSLENPKLTLIAYRQPPSMPS